MIKNFLSCLLISFLFFIAFPLEGHAINSSSLLFNRALNESRAGDFPQALNSWNEFLNLFPKDPIALSNRGNVRLAMGDPKGAILDQTQAISLLPLEVDPHLNRGIAEEALGQFAEAMEDYRWVLERQPDNSFALYNLGNVMISQSDWAKAKSFFQRASLASPDFVMARSSKALACYQLNQLDEAEKDLRSVVRKYPMFADGRAALSALLWKQGHFGEAESHWVATSALDSRYMNKDWLVNIRRWPPEPTKDLMSFLDLQKV